MRIMRENWERASINPKADGKQPASKDVEVDSPAVYRVAITLQAAPK
jgi:hypothetical protein